MGKKKKLTKALTRQIVSNFEQLLDVDPEAALDAVEAVHDVVGDDPRVLPYVLERVTQNARQRDEAVRNMIQEAGVTVLEMNVEEAAKFISEHAVSVQPHPVEQDVTLNENKEN